MTDVLSHWHSIRPWRPILSLTVREITSVSATFILSSPLAASESTNGEPFLASLGLSRNGVDVDDSEESDGDDTSTTIADGGSRHTQIISDVLSKGLSVKVNGTPWQRVLMKIDDEADEAVIILFGLMPGRQYDIELGIVPCERTLRGQITTGITRPRSDTDSSQELSATDFTVADASILTTSPSNGSAGSPSLLTPSPSHPTISHNPTPPPSFSLEDRRSQLTHTLNLLNAEHATLTSSLKSARRESQKADAALRSEIETLKRSSEKHTPLETRAKQKVLALQEAVRRTVAATEEIRRLIEEVEGVIPELEKRRREVEIEWEWVNKEADVVRERRSEVEAKERRRVESLQAEVAVLGNRMERLNVRKEKLEGEGGVISELEEKLRKLEEERVRVESDSFEYGYREDEEFGQGGDGRSKGSADGASRSEDSTPERYFHHNQARDQSHSHSHSPNPRPHHNSHHHNHNHHHPRKRHSHPAHQQRPPIPIQRPTHNSRLSLPAGPGVIHLNRDANINLHHYPHQHPHPHPHPHQHNKNQPQTQQIPQQNQSPAQSQAGGSNLSSRALPFEPSGRRPGPQAGSQLQTTPNIGPAPTGGMTSELSPGTYPFAPRTGAQMGTSQNVGLVSGAPPGISQKRPGAK